MNKQTLQAIAKQSENMITLKDLKIGLSNGNTYIYQTKFSGKLRVLSVESYRSAVVEFLSTGYRTKANLKNIKIGNVKDPFYPRLFGVGYLGGSNYSHRRDKVAYEKWKNMLQRCYSNNPAHKTYKDCIVSEEWHNFQNFAKWHYENYPNDGGKYVLDKDFKIKGNRCYSAKACQYMTNKENLSFNRNTIEYLIKNRKTKEVRVVRYLAEFCREVGINLKNLSSMLHGKSKSSGGWYLLSNDLILFNGNNK